MVDDRWLIDNRTFDLKRDKNHNSILHFFKSTANSIDFL